jgi:hypothetical protein
MPEIRIGTFNAENLFLRYRPLQDEKTNRPRKAPDADTLNVSDFAARSRISAPSATPNAN